MSAAGWKAKNEGHLNGQSLLGSIAWQPFAGMKSWTQGNGQAVARSFDRDGRLKTQSLDIGSRTLDYDAKGRLTNIAEPWGNRTYGYDTADRIATHRNRLGWHLELRLGRQRQPAKLDEALAEIVVEIGHPYWTEPGVEAACPVAIRGAVGRVNDIHGIEPMSAMKQAISFVETYLDHPAGDMKFFWPDGEAYE